MHYTLSNKVLLLHFFSRASSTLRLDPTGLVDFVSKKSTPLVRLGCTFRYMSPPLPLFRCRSREMIGTHLAAFLPVKCSQAHGTFSHRPDPPANRINGAPEFLNNNKQQQTHCFLTGETRDPPHVTSSSYISLDYNSNWPQGADISSSDLMDGDWGTKWTLKNLE